MPEQFRLLGELPLAPGATGQLLPDEAHHLLRVMRAPAGTSIRVFNGAGWAAALTLAETAEPPHPVRITGAWQVLESGGAIAGLGLAIPWLKSGNTEFLAEKLTECGAERLWIYQAERAIAKGDAAKLAKLQRTCAEACKQCGRVAPPAIELVGGGVAALLARLPSGCLPLALAERAGEAAPTLTRALSEAFAAQAAAALATAAAPAPAVCILSGPEGGFTPAELALPGWRAVTLGPRILRAETAPIVASALYASACGIL